MSTHGAGRHEISAPLAKLVRSREKEPITCDIIVKSEKGEHSVPRLKVVQSLSLILYGMNIVSVEILALVPILLT